MSGSLKVLMWKHVVVRARRFIHTPIEILSPAILFITLFSIKNNIIGGRSTHQEEFNVHQTEPVYLNSVKGPDSIFYTPQTDLTSLLMNKVGESLTYQEKYSNVMKKPKITPAVNKEELSKFSKEIDDSVAFVLFQNISGTWPEKLHYTIRTKNTFNTHTFRSYYALGQHDFYGTIYEPFMKLQWAIDSNYLELLTGNKITQRVTLQEFPYVTSKENDMAKTICTILMALCWISLMLVFVFLVARLLEERITGIQELIKMVGVSDSMLGLSHVLNMVPAGLVYSVLPAVLVTVSSLPLLPNTNPLLVFIVLALHYITVVALAFSASYIINSTQYTESLAVLSYVLLYLPCPMLENRDVPGWIFPLCGLLPHVPLQWFWNEVAALQQYGVGLTFATIATSHSPKSGSVLACYLCFVIQACLFFGLAWYLAKVKPGPYGQSRPWNFMCQKQYWSKKKVMPEEEEEFEELDEVNNEPQYFEPPPKDMEVGIKIINVSKMFGKQRALSDVTLDVYKGEITVLLGHNGAGKTTLMSIITGMLKASEGEVYVEGLDTYKQRDDMQRILGLCPQHNLFFPDLTVMEHVMFFTMLKGTTYAEAKKSSVALLEQLGIANKSSNKSSQLSGGMKRRLQLACALAGDAKVLVLDEPTSGLDVETRRELWDLLLSLRGSRTVLLSTHFMEEAEALGDRVAALHAGRLRCHATTMHLKRALGTGYRLSFTTIGQPNEPAITTTITSEIPEATVKETSLNSISFNLPSKCSNKFPKLFSLLESKRSALGIDSIGVGISTLEEVFLKLCSDVTTSFSDDAVDGQTEEPTFKTMSGVRLFFHQIAALLKRQVMYLWSKKFSFLIIQVLIPIALICCITIFTNNGFSIDNSALEDPSVSLDLNLYNDMADRRVLYSVNVTGVNMLGVGKKNPKVDFERTSDVASAVVRIGRKDIFEYNNYLVGIELNETDAKVLFTTVVRHAAPVALNLLTNTIATQLLPYADGETVTTYNYPVPSSTTYATRVDAPESKSQFTTMLWAFCVVLVTQATVLSAASLACGERAAGARRGLALGGAAPGALWAAALLAHALLYALVLVLPAVLAAAALDRDATIDRPAFLGAIAVILFLGIVAFLAVIYLVSFNFEEHGANIVHVAMVFIFGFFTPTVKTLTDTFSHGKNFGDYVLSVLSYVLPPHTLTACALRAAHVAAQNPVLAAANVTETLCYFCIDDNSPGGLMIVMLVQFIVYMSIVILTEYGFFNMMFDRLLNSRYQVSSPVDADEMVRAEKAYVDKAITLPKNQIQDAMLVNDVHKKYWRLFGKSCNAIKGVSFSVKKGECFGLLGVNGAGKSSTFKMLTGIEYPTRGSIFANGYFMNPFSTKYFHSLGYCPQNAGLDDFLTGYENLKLLLTLRGLEPADAESEAKTWIEIVGLEKHAHRRVAGYSGGCARRLSAAAALCGAGAAALLDEPTAGVDVAARRRVWAALRRAQPARALVVSSHSMDEMEALCARLAILAAGRLRALGGAAALRAAHAAGHAVLLKLAAGRARGDVTDGSKSELNRLKAALQQEFDCTLRDEHRTMLHYHINDTMRYSELFTKLENLRKNFSLLEDYSVTETTLEEVFLSFAKEEAQDEPTPV